MPSPLVIRMKMLLRNRVGGILVALVAVALVSVLFYVPSVRAMTDSYENTSSSKREQLRLLRRALKENMEEYLGKGVGSTFIPDGKVATLTKVSAEVYTDHVMSSRPFIISNPDLYKCTKTKWTLDFIDEQAGDDVVGIETSKNNRFYSNEGLVKARMSVSEFLKTFRNKDRKRDFYLAEESMKQFPRLEEDVAEPSYSSAYSLDKTQLWIGAGGQVSPLHHDQWDNVLCQIEGNRTVTLFDPLQSDYLYPKTGINRHFSQLDPSKPDFSRFPNFRNAKSFSATLRAGQQLFIPAGWWHQVHHQASVNIAVNFWYMPNIMTELLLDSILPAGYNY